MLFLVATKSLPVGRPNADRLEPRTLVPKEKNGIFSGHYVIASSLPPEQRDPNDDRWNAACLCQYVWPIKKLNTIFISLYCYYQLIVFFT